MSKVEVMNGNKSAAVGAALARPDVIAAYPITPQTPLVEYLTQFKADGEIDAVLSEVESELSAMSVLTGASLAGSRTFTATSSQGLSLMYEPYFRASTLRLPIVMCIVNREMISPQTLWGGPQDSLSVRDAGWLQVYVENNQEILDMVIQAFKIAEDKKVLLPINICYDGFYLSHMSERVEIPEQEPVDKFLGRYIPEHIKLDPKTPMAVDPLTNGYLLTEYRYKHLDGQKNALDVIQKTNDKYSNIFGRNYGGLVEEYRLEDAEYVIVAMGSMSGAAKEAVDRKRDQDIKVGLLRLRVIRPFPAEKISSLLKGRKSYGVIDRNVSFGWNHGITFQEINSAMYRNRVDTPSLPFIGGLGGEDVRIEHFEYAIDKVVEYSKNPIANHETIWLNKVI